MDSRQAQISAGAALGEPTRRRLYNYMLRQPGPVSRDEAAAALSLSRSTAGFHLGRLVEQRLLDSGYQHLTGRSGPGAGRPAKLYRRSSRQVKVSLPQRCYEPTGRLLSNALNMPNVPGNHRGQSLMSTSTRRVKNSAKRHVPVPEIAALSTAHYGYSKTMASNCALKPMVSSSVTAASIPWCKIIRNSSAG